MVQYSVLDLNIDGKDLIGIEDLREVERNALSTQNAIYIYRGAKTQKIYIGQTANFMQRHNQHYSGMEERFNTADFEEVIVLFQDTLIVLH